MSEEYRPYIGIDIGSTCAKTAVMDDCGKLVFYDVRPTGWSSADTAMNIYDTLVDKGCLPPRSEEGIVPSTRDAIVIATGYGRVSVPFADKTITEITCHAKGAEWLFDEPEICVIDIGGQDTKIIRIERGNVADFFMNDKCSAGTGRFLEVMGNTMGLSPLNLCELARQGGGVKISSLCTVFAESEVISLVGKGETRENIAHAVVDSIADKVVSQSRRLIKPHDAVCLTGGLCECRYLIEMLEAKLGTRVRTAELARYAGAIGAALLAQARGRKDAK
ncbi:MAG: CoA activase [Eggerthellaceae bacterium]|nr:CoA activase [Eggerthellaceae bacterium]